MSPLFLVDWEVHVKPLAPEMIRCLHFTLGMGINDVPGTHDFPHSSNVGGVREIPKNAGVRTLFLGKNFMAFSNRRCGSSRSVTIMASASSGMGRVGTNGSREFAPAEIFSSITATIFMGNSCAHRAAISLKSPPP